MKRSWTEDANQAADGGIDIGETSAGNQELSTTSSGHLVNEVASSLHTDSQDWKTSPQTVPDGNGNVKWSSSDTAPFRSTEVLGDFGWMTNKIDRGRLVTVIDDSSLVYVITDGILSTIQILAPTANHRLLEPSSIDTHSQQSLISSPGTVQHTDSGNKIDPVSDTTLYSVINRWTDSPAYVSDVSDLEPSPWLPVDSTFDTLQILSGKSAAFDPITISTVLAYDPDFGSLIVDKELLVTPSEASARRKAFTATTLFINNSVEPTINLSSPTIALTDISTAHGGSGITEVTSPSLHKHNVAPLGTSFLAGASQRPGPGISLEVIPTQVTLEPPIFVGLGDVFSFITPGIIPVDTVEPHTAALPQSDTAVYLVPGRSAEHWFRDVASSSFLGDNYLWLHIPHLTNIGNTTELLASVTNIFTAVRGSVSSPTTLPVWSHRTPVLSLEDTVLFPRSTFTFPSSSFRDHLLSYSGKLLTTPEAESQSMNDSETNAGSDNTTKSRTSPGHPDTLSVAKLFQPASEVVNILLSHSSVNYKLAPDTLIIITQSMEISTSSSVDLQPSSTLSYHSTLSEISFEENDNTNNFAEVFNDLNAQFTSHQLPSSQSPTTDQVLTQNTANYSSISPGLDPAPTVSASSTMFMTWDQSGQTLSPVTNVTDVLQVTGGLTTTHKMNISDGETSSRQVPNFNTTIIIASAGAVLALVIFVIITICCLRRRRRSKSSSSRQEGDDLWVDLYRSNSSHQMPLPSLTTCHSTFEMTDILKSGSTEEISGNKNKDGHTPEASSSVINKMKSQRQISSFQIKNPKQEPLEPMHPVSELGFSEDHAENWVKMAASLSMTSLPTTEVSYHTNVTDYNLAAVGQKFRAVYNYKPVCKGEMALKEGELVECKERDRNGWMLGYKPRTNEEGWFPAVYVDELSIDDDLDFTCEVPETYDILESNKLNSTDQYWTGIEHRVCYSYYSSVPGDLDIQVGQIIIVLQTLANGWWFAVSGNKCGWFPGSYVEMIPDSSTEEQPLNDNMFEQDDPTRVSTEAQDVTAVQTMEDKSDTTSASLVRISELPVEKECVQENLTNNEKPIVANETSRLNVSTSTAVQAGDNNELKESKCTVDTSEIKSTVLSTLNEQTPDTESAGSLSINSGTDVRTDKLSLRQKRPEKSLRPVRPAPPPPKPQVSKIKKVSKISSENNEMQTSETQDPVLKKPVILIHGKRPKMQKILRSQLDEKQLSPMIRPSTRGFIPKPAAYTHSGSRNEYSSMAGHAHSSQSITNYSHSEQTMSSAAHNSSSHRSPFQSLNFRPITHQDYKSSKSSLESCPENRLVYPRGSTPHSEHDKINQFNLSNYFSHERSLTPDYRRERSITPDYKRNRSNSPTLLTTGNLLQNVQRFQGALKHPIPLGHGKGSLKGSSDEKREMEFTQANPSANTLSTFGRQQQPAFTTAPNFKTSSQKSLHNKQSFDTPHDQNHGTNSINVSSDHESLNKYSNSEKMLPTNMLPKCVDSNSGNMSHTKQYPSKCLQSENMTVHQEPFIVTPGTVSEIVQQINKQLPLHTELLQKLKTDRRQPEPVDFSNREHFLVETNANKLTPADQSQSTSNNGFRDVTSNNLTNAL